MRIRVVAAMFLLLPACSSAGSSDPVKVADFVATIYQLMGIDPHMTVNDRQGRPIPIAQGGDPVFDVIG